LFSLSAACSEWLRRPRNNLFGLNGIIRGRLFAPIITTIFKGGAVLAAATGQNMVVRNTVVAMAATASRRVGIALVQRCVRKDTTIMLIPVCAARNAIDLLEKANQAPQIHHVIFV
jgi:hypothetical protein